MHKDVIDNEVIEPYVKPHGFSKTILNEAQRAMWSLELGSVCLSDSAHLAVLCFCM